MFELTIILDGGHSMSSFNFNGAAYTLIFGPQIGPRFERLVQRQEYRNFVTFRGRLRTERVNEREPTIIHTQPAWAAIVGKYFTFVALPYLSQFELGFSSHPEEGLPAASRMLITRPATVTSRIEDRFHFYLGPKNEPNLRIYERGDNVFRLRETGIVELSDSRGFLAPLEKILKWLLLFFHGIIPNYGVAIILLTLAVKVVMFPLTKKSSESTLRMQTFAPKIKEIQEKYKGNQQKIHAETAELYKRENYNPLSGCFPMLIQLPIFLTMFQLFNNHFELRGAMFIPGWITDLSRPESIIDFPEGVALPLLGWTAIRLLPFIYVGSQLLYGKVTQNPQQGSNAQMKLMLYAMPIIFFFVLYDMPSGLLVYWIMSNVLTLVQQSIINKYIVKRKAAIAEATPAVVSDQRPGKGRSNKSNTAVIPPKKKKKK
jgi:YidC/Oxa1 family membrane protein insertase